MTAIFDSWLAGGERARRENLDDDKRARQQRLDQQKQKMDQQTFDERKRVSQGKRMFKDVSLLNQYIGTGNDKGIRRVFDSWGKISPEMKANSDLMLEQYNAGGVEAIKQGARSLHNQGIELGAIAAIKGPDSAASGAFGGKGMPAQVSNALVRGANNPKFRNSAQYARAWDIANKPQIIDTEEGRVPLYPEINPMFQPPGPAKSTKEQINEIKSSVRKDVKVIRGTEKKKTTDSEKKSAGYLLRMNESEENIKALGDFNSADWLEKAKGLTNVTASGKMQNYRQAADDWIRSKLREESGAVIGPEEMAKEYQIYYPQLGDKQPVIDQKKRARAAATKAMTIAAGRAGVVTANPDNKDISNLSLDDLMAEKARLEGSL